jgi:outer membrane immunogenic protein
MKSHLIATLGLAALLAGSAHAADMGVMRKAPAVMEDPWTGFYLGIDGGYGKATSTHSLPAVGDLATFDQKGWVAGGFAGYNWRPGLVLVGVELDISGADIVGSTVAGGCAAAAFGVVGCETKLSWFYTGRVRLGLPLGPVMPYVTGGGIVGGLKVTEGTFSPSGANPHLAGWVAGGGVEFMVLPQWTIRGEYLHADLSGHMDATDLSFTVTEHNINIVRVGLTYYLGADKGILAK